MGRPAFQIRTSGIFVENSYHRTAVREAHKEPARSDPMEDADSAQKVPGFSVVPSLAE